MLESLVSIEDLERAFAPIRAKIINKLIECSERDNFEIPIDPVNQQIFDMRRGIEEYVNHINIPSGRGFAGALEEMPPSDLKNMARFIFTEKFFPMLYLGNIKFGSESENVQGEKFVPKYPNLVIPSKDAAFEIMNMLNDGEYRTLCAYVARMTKKFYQDALNKTTEGHRNLYHGREFPTKGDLYVAMSNEALQMMKASDVEDVAILREKYPIGGF